MSRMSYPLNRYPKYRTELMAGMASVGISELKVNPVRYIMNANARPIKVLRYGHLAALIISPEFYDQIAGDLKKARADNENMKALLGAISTDLLSVWLNLPEDFTGAAKRTDTGVTGKLPPLADSYIQGIEELLDDLYVDDEKTNSKLDPKLRDLVNFYKARVKKQAKPKA